jgi:hypothetical protein
MTSLDNCFSLEELLAWMRHESPEPFEARRP